MSASHKPRSESARMPTRLSVRYRTVGSMLYRYGARHWQPFLWGLAAALLVVAARLALPWPLRALAEQWIPSEGDQTPFLLANVPEGVSAPLAMGAAFFIILLILGLCDFIERLHFARFSIGTVKDIRADAFARATQSNSLARKYPGDLVARLVGDTARLKAGLKGFLVHVATNVVLFVGVTIVLFVLNPTLGWLFAGAATVTLLITAAGANSVFRKSLRNRKREGKLADTIQHSLRNRPDETQFRRLNRSSGEHEASVTRTSGKATWATYIVFGGTVFVALWLGSGAVEADRMTASDMLLFMMYALMMRGPIVRLARQGTRSGKIFAAGYRLAQVVSDHREIDRTEAVLPTLGPLGASLQLIGVSVIGSKARQREPRMGPIDLSINAGERVAVVGDTGSGKSTLLKTMAGRRELEAGCVLWDGIRLDASQVRSLETQAAYISNPAKWRAQKLRHLLGDGDQAGITNLSTNLSRSIDSIIASLPDGLDSRLASSDLSAGERRLLTLAQFLGQDASLRLIDDPGAGLPLGLAADLITALTSSKIPGTVVLALSEPIAIDRFDRVIELRDKVIIFDGSPARWRSDDESHCHAIQTTERSQ